MKYLPVLSAFLLLSSCDHSHDEKGVSKSFEAIVLKEVEEAVWAFHAADTSRNAEAVINLMWPECNMLIDGNRIQYDDLVNGARSFMPTLKVFHTEWTDLDIIPINPENALSSFIFNDSIVTNSGVITRAKGPNTFLWQRRGSEWRIIYGDADHYPID